MPIRRRPPGYPKVGGLALTRKPGEIIHIHTSDGMISLQVARIKTDTYAVLTFNAPDEVTILRSELDVQCEEN